VLPVAVPVEAYSLNGLSPQHDIPLVTANPLPLLDDPYLDNGVEKTVYSYLTFCTKVTFFLLSP